MNESVKPSREEVLKVAGEPVAMVDDGAYCAIHWLGAPLPKHKTNLYTESQLLQAAQAAYAAGAADMKERAAKLCDDMPCNDPEGPWFNDDMTEAAMTCATGIRSLPITPDKHGRRAEMTQTALEQFHECDGHNEESPIERLRFFCSLAMKGRDWLDVEPFFDSVQAQLTAANERITKAEEMRSSFEVKWHKALGELAAEREVSDKLEHYLNNVLCAWIEHESPQDCGVLIENARAALAEVAAIRAGTPTNTEGEQG